MNIDKAIHTAIKHYQAGEIKEAEYICKEVLKIQPDNADMLQLLIGIAYQLGKLDSAIKHLKKALESDENNALNLNTFGLMFQDMGEFDEAIQCFEKALKVDPEFADAWYNLGVSFQEKGLFDNAIKSYNKSIDLDANNADAYVNLGNILQIKRQLDEAASCYKKAIQADPYHAYAYNNLGYVFHEQGHVDESIIYYQRALQIDPDLVNTYYNLGNAFLELDKLNEATESYNNAVLRKPDFFMAYVRLGDILDYQGRKDEAISAYDKALMYRPNFFIARFGRCMSQLRTIYPDVESIETSRKRYLKELLHLRNTIFFETQQDIKDAAEAVGSHQPFLLAYQGFNDRELQKAYGDIVCRIMSLRYPEFSERPEIPICSPEEPLRIGFVSGFFYLHSNWKLRRGWVENLDKNRFSLFGYHTGGEKDDFTEGLRQHFSRFVEDISSFEELCRIIREDNLHVMIYPEIGMDPFAARLAALRLAPIQCTSWGHPETSGLPSIDYFLSSELMEPPNADDHYTEKLIRLPNLGIYYSPLNVPFVSKGREQFGLNQEAILYLCPQSLFKYLPQYDEVYPRIAQQVGDCRFLFISSQLSDWVTEQFRSRLNQVFKRYSMNADDYMVFLPRLEMAEYYAINRLSDIYLDSLGWSGCNSTLEAIECNLPIVTFSGAFMRGRHSSAILTMMGVKENIASSVDEYIELAVRLGKDSDWRQQISEKIAENKHRIYFDKTCITALEEFFEIAVREKIG